MVICFLDKNLKNFNIAEVSIDKAALILIRDPARFMRKTGRTFTQFFFFKKTEKETCS